MASLGAAWIAFVLFSSQSLASARASSATGGMTKELCKSSDRDDVTIVGFCNFLPCSSNHGDNVECTSPVGYKFTGARAGVAPVLARLGFARVCACTSGTCSFDHFHCKSFEDWNTTVAKYQRKSVNASQDFPTAARSVGIYFLMMFILIVLLIVFVKVILCALKSTAHIPLKCMSLRKFLAPDSGHAVWNGNKCLGLFRLISEVVAFTFWFLHLSLESVENTPPSSLTAVCVGAQSMTVRMDMLFFGFVMVILGEIYVEIPACLLKRLRLLDRDRPDNPFTLYGPTVTIDSTFTIVDQSSGTYTQYGKIVQVILRLAGMNLILVYGMERDIAATMVLLWFIIVLRGIFVLRITVSKTDHKHKWEQAMTVIHELEISGEERTDPEAASETRKPLKEKYLGVKVDDIYMDLTVPFGKKCALIFCSQVFLTSLYSSALRDDLFTSMCEDTINWPLLYPTCAIQLLMVTQMGNGIVCSLIDWTKLFHAREGENFVVYKQKGDGTGLEKLDFPLVRVRFLMSLIVNGIIYSFLIQTVFLTLISDDDGMDYVKDCLAVGFITVVDDVSYDDPIQLFVNFDTVSREVNAVRDSTSSEEEALLSSQGSDRTLEGIPVGMQS